MVYSVGIVGCGVIGQRLAKAFDQVEGTSIVAVCDLDRQKSEELASTYQVRTYVDAEEMVKNEDLDILYIGIPPKYHYSMVKLATTQNLHIICEKPLAESSQVGRRMVNLVEQAKVCSAINLPFRYTPGFRRMIEIYQSGELGIIRRVDLVFRFPKWPRIWQDVDWLKTREQGGPLREVGTHFLFALLELFGSISRVMAWLDYPVPDQYERTAVGMMETQQGIPVLFDLLTDTKDEEENIITLHGSKKSISLVDWYRLVENFKTPDEKILNEERMNTSTQLISEFVNLLDSAKGNVVSFEEARRTQQILDSIYVSNSKWVEL